MSWRETSGHYKARWTGYRADRRAGGCAARPGPASSASYLVGKPARNTENVRAMGSGLVRRSTPVSHRE
jgi:hypothetical protein